ncbi:MAG: carboxypeptidase-like regulatory domain-containing protein [Sphingobacteriaceae bacterium]|nr:carboxypeptidase-like regulatory domain-containing protein [Sphingobacteriaceae bacterium]
MKKLFILFFIVNQFLNAQTVCKGKLIDESNGSPVEFANIGILGKGIGTVSDENGEYSLMIPDSLKNETIQISLIGYETIKTKSKDLITNPIAKMKQVSVNLKEISVTSKKIKTKILGNKTTAKGISAGFKNNNLGTEMAIKLNIKNKQTHLKSLMFQVNNNEIDSVIFRVNLYCVGKNGLPDTNLLQQNIYITMPQKTGFIKTDLTPYNLFLDEDAFISIEWIKDLGDASKLSFATKLVGSATYFRQASQDKWEKVSPIGIGLHVEVAY